MLKITTIRQNESVHILKLEGKLSRAWIPELQSACQLARQESQQLRLDLSDVSFIDGPGIVVLRELIQQGITVTTSSPFISELLKEKSS
jgi:ABC-type transporter Mla MlaB component